MLAPIKPRRLLRGNRDAAPRAAPQDEVGSGGTPPPMRLAGRIALITGASRGLGAAAALAYAREGAHCVPWRARWAGSRRSTTRSRPPAAAPPWCRSTSPMAPASTAWERRCTSASEARHPAGQCRAAGHPVADRPHRSGDLRARDGGERDRELAPDPLARPAAAPVRCRPRDLRHLGRVTARSCPTGVPTPPARPPST